MFDRRLTRYFEKRDEEIRVRDERWDAEAKERDEEARRREQQWAAEARKRDEEAQKRDDRWAAESRRRDQEARESRERLDVLVKETREFNREILFRNEKVYTSLIAQVEESTEEIRANTRAVLSVLDRLDGLSA